MSDINGTETPRKRHAAVLTKHVTPHVIHPTAVYTVAAAQEALGLRDSTVRREVREGRLRISKRAGKHYLLGSWLLDWIEAGEVGKAKGNGGANGKAAE